MNSMLDISHKKSMKHPFSANLYSKVNKSKCFQATDQKILHIRCIKDSTRYESKISILQMNHKGMIGESEWSMVNIIVRNEWWNMIIKLLVQKHDY